MDIGAIGAWVQGQGLLVKVATVILILIVAGLAIAYVLKVPDKAQAPTKSVNVSDPAPQPSAASSSFVSSDQHPVRHRPASSDPISEPDPPKIEVRSENQTGGITAGQIGDLNINNEKSK